MMKKLLLTLLLFPTLLQAATEERWYQVELLLFSNNNSNYHRSELWPIDYSEPQIENSLELGKAAKKGGKTPQAFALLPSEELKLGGAAARIKRAPDMNLELHLGWLQPGLAEDKAVAIHIYDGMLKDIKNRKSAVQAKKPENNGVEEQRPKLDGTLRLILSRYLHLESDLIWRDPLSAEELALRRALPVITDSNEETSDGSAVAVMPAEDAMAHEATGETPQEKSEAPLITHHVYRMQQSRRMRSNETHYLDHPRFGIVARVTPYEPEKAEAEQDNN